MGWVSVSPSLSFALRRVRALPIAIQMVFGANCAALLTAARQLWRRHPVYLGVISRPALPRCASRPRPRSSPHPRPSRGPITSPRRGPRPRAGLELVLVLTWHVAQVCRVSRRAVRRVRLSAVGWVAVSQPSRGCYSLLGGDAHGGPLRSSRSASAHCSAYPPSIPPRCLHRVSADPLGHTMEYSARSVRYW